MSIPEINGSNTGNGVNHFTVSFSQAPSYRHIYIDMCYCEKCRPGGFRPGEKHCVGLVYHIMCVDHCDSNRFSIIWEKIYCCK